MASFLSSHTKSVLLQLAEDWDIEVSSNDSKKKIIQAITSAADYDEEVIKNGVAVIAREEADRKNEENKRKDLEREREHELEKLRLQNNSEVASVASVRSENDGSRKKIN